MADAAHQFAAADRRQRGSVKLGLLRSTLNQGWWFPEEPDRSSLDGGTVQPHLIGYPPTLAGNLLARGPEVAGNRKLARWRDPICSKAHLSDPVQRQRNILPAGSALDTLARKVWRVANRREVAAHHQRQARLRPTTPANCRGG
jgi:hypothetical protein